MLCLQWAYKCDEIIYERFPGMVVTALFDKAPLLLVPCCVTNVICWLSAHLIRRNDGDWWLIFPSEVHVTPSTEWSPPFPFGSKRDVIVPMVSMPVPPGLYAFWEMAGLELNCEVDIPGKAAARRCCNWWYTRKLLVSRLTSDMPMRSMLDATCSLLKNSIVLSESL